MSAPDPSGAPVPERPHPTREWPRQPTAELIGFGVIVVLAAILRLVNLSTRGTWDADQGHDMLVLRNLVQAGQIPLLGPPTSIGDFHHGMLYYVLLAPAAAVSGADPTAVTAWIAIGGIVAVVVTGWLARVIAGPIAGLVAALLLAVSASAVDESTFIWNPNLIALSSSVALAAAWHAWQSERPRWWLVAGAAAVVTMHCHVLGIILTPVVGALLVADIRRRRRRGDTGGAGAVTRSALGWLGLGLLSYVPLAIHEIGNDASELRAAIAFLTGGGGAASIGLAARLPIVALRVLGWPLTGLITAAPIATLLAAGLVVALTVWRASGRVSTRARGSVAGGPDAASTGDPVNGSGPMADDERTAVRWLGLGLAWTVIALAVGATSLATVVPGLPNDHYHAFADPMVIVLVAVGIAALLGRRQVRRDDARSMVGALIGAAILLVLVGWNFATQPPAIAPDGGWPAAMVAADRITVATGGGPVVLESLPAVKSAEAVRFPLERLRAGIVVDPAAPAAAAANRVVLCDELFHETIGADCGGPAEDALLASPVAVPPRPANLQLVDRFEAAPGRWISVYRPG